MSVSIRPETSADREPIRQVNRLAFGQEEEGRLVGFSSQLVRRLKSPFSGEAFMAAELVPGTLADATR